MMRIKWPLLIAIFAIPLLIVFILHIFGKNRFDVPVYYNERPHRVPVCGYTPVPFKADYAYVGNDSLTAIFAIPEEVSQEQKLQILRYKDRFSDKPVKALLITMNSDPVVGCSHLKLVSGDFLDVITCQLIMEEGTDVVLVDGNKRIRGYYTASDREEIDRLSVETEILLKNGEFKPGSGKDL